jgi:hypothetical protein
MSRAENREHVSSIRHSCQLWQAVDRAEQRIGSTATLFESIELAKADSLPPLSDGRAAKDISFLQTLPRKYGGTTTLDRVIEFLNEEIAMNARFFIGPDQVPED